MRKRWSTTAQSLLAGGLLTVLLMAVAAFVVDLSEVIQAITEAEMVILVWGPAVALVADMMGGLGWWALLWQHRVAPVRTALINVSAIGLNHLSPVRIVGEPVQYGLVVMHEDAPGGAVIGSIALHRLLDIAVLAVLVGGGTLLLPQIQVPAEAVVSGVLAVPLLIAAFFLLGRRMDRAPWVGRFGVVRQFGEYAGALAKDLRATAGALAFLVAYRAGLGLAGWTIAVSMGLDIGVAGAMVATLTALFLSVNIPGFIAGIGIFEGIMVLLLGGFAIETETALAFAVLLHGTLLLPPLLIALLFLPREGVRSIGVVQDMIDRWRERRAEGGASS